MSVKDGDAAAMSDKTPSDPQIAAVSRRGSVRAPLRWLLAALGVAATGGGGLAAMQAHVGDRTSHVNTGEREETVRFRAEVTAALSGLKLTVDSIESTSAETAGTVRAIMIDLAAAKAVEQDRRRRRSNDR